MKLTVTAVALALAALPAQAALSPCTYDDLVKAADTVVQIDQIRVSAPLKDPLACLVEGRIAHVLRGEAAVGDGIAVTVACEWDGMVGPTMYNDRAALAAAAMIELHLTGGEVAGYGAGLSIIDPAAAGGIAHRFNCD